VDYNYFKSKQCKNIDTAFGLYQYHSHGTECTIFFYKQTSTQAKRVLTKKERKVITMKLKPLGDRVVLKHQDAEEKTQSGIILPDSAKEKPQAAIVVAVGPGKEENGHKVEMQVKEGDKVIYSKYSGTDVKFEDEEYTIVSQNDIIATLE
jgi:chaperonin GroES